MGDFILKELVTSNIESELEKIGFDIAYRAKASDKFKYKTFKIFNLTIPQANILKQTALSFGADCGVHRDVLTANIEKTNVVLGGSYSQLKKICERLRQQPFSMKILAENLVAQLDLQERKTKLVGILNITPDSFSDGGMYFEEYNARKQLFQLVEDGADVIDIGAESTRPGAEQIDAKIQIERLRPILKDLPEIPISVDTRSSEVAMFALDNGVQIINDVSGMDFDLKIVDVVKNYNASLVIQHSTGDAGNIIPYNDVVEDVYLTLLKKSQLALEKGLKNLILDVGIGFGKSKENNFQILNRIEEFYSLNYPLMVGISRKSFLGISKSKENDLKDALSLAISYPLMLKNIDYLRVHNVKIHKQLLDLAI
jgi:dihydropteroate synthase